MFIVVLVVLNEIPQTHDLALILALLVLMSQLVLLNQKGYSL
jgi:hypothetical protein